MKSITESKSWPDFAKSLLTLQNKALPARVAYAKEKGKLTDYVDLLVDLEGTSESLTATVKAVDAEIEWLRSIKIPEVMAEREEKTVTTDKGHRVTISVRYYASIKTGMKELAFKWLRKNKHGAIIQEVVNAGTLGSLAKDLMENKAQELPQEWFNTSPKSVTSLTKFKA